MKWKWKEVAIWPAIMGAALIGRFMKPLWDAIGRWLER